MKINPFQLMGDNKSKKKKEKEKEKDKEKDKEKEKKQRIDIQKINFKNLKQLVDFNS